MIKTENLNIQYKLDGRLKFQCKMLLLVSIFSLSATFLMPEIVKAGTHYVSPTGSASWANSTKINSPCSVTTAEQNADDGDIVYFRGGTYTNETLTPTNSGSSGNVITFIAYSGETPIFDGTNTTDSAIILSSRDYIVIDGFTVRRYNSAMIYSIHLTNLSEYLTIQNCTVEQPGARGNIIMARGNVSNFSILNSTVNISNGTDIGQGGIVIYGYNKASDQVRNTRIEGNTLIGAGWTGVGDAITIHKDDTPPYASPGNYHLIKDNTIYNWKENCVDLASTSEYIVVTGNTLYDGYSQVITGGGKNRRIYDNDIYGVNHFKGSEWIYGGSTDWTDGGVFQIIRNRFWGRGNGLYFQADTRYVYDLYIAHNTFDGTDANFGDSNHLAPFHIRSTDSSIDNINFINNIYYYKSGIVGNKLISVSDTEINSDYNLFYEITNSPGANVLIEAGKGRTLSYVQDDGNYDQENNSIEDNPDFTNTAANDYTLRDGSPAIDVGGWLTTITKATGSGTTFTVADPLWFYDGWNISGEIGDTIKTEKGQIATITSINYSTGAITVDRSISWTNGEGIGLDYKGTRPDIGAKEYLSGILPSPKPLPNPKPTIAISSPKGFKVISR